MRDIYIAMSNSRIYLHVRYQLTIRLVLPLLLLTRTAVQGCIVATM
jgi:hypothetical protein